MIQAIWNDTILAETDDTIMVEGNHYFPVDSLRREYFKASAQTTVCPWKGTASYYDIEVDGRRNPGAAWVYAEPKEAAERIRGRVAFWRGVDVVQQ